LKRLNKFIMYLILTLTVIITILPFIWMISASFKDIREIFSYPPTIIPDDFSFSNYLQLFAEYPFARNIFNSTFIAVTATTGSLFFCTLGGFGFAKFDFKFKNQLFLVLIASMLIPPQSIMIPLFLVFKRIGWVNTFYPLIVPGLANAFGIFFMRQYMTSIPDSLIEAARIDGGSDFYIFLKIIVPIVKPALATLGIIFFMNSWNAFVWPLIILQDIELQTIPVVLTNLQGVIYTPYNLIMAGSVISIIPLFVVFMFMQQYFISGITAGAVKQ